MLKFGSFGFSNPEVSSFAGSEFYPLLWSKNFWCAYSPPLGDVMVLSTTLVRRHGGGLDGSRPRLGLGRRLRCARTRASPSIPGPRRGRAVRGVPAFRPAARCSGKEATAAAGNTGGAMGSCRRGRHEGREKGLGVLGLL
jgi:hypothetical protein